MEITIGVRNVSQNVVFRSDQSTAEIQAAVTASIRNGEPLVLPTARGGQVIVPAEAIGYVELDENASRTVGFSL